MKKHVFAAVLPLAFSVCLAQPDSDAGGGAECRQTDIRVSGALTVESSPEWCEQYTHPGTPLNAVRIVDEPGRWASVARLSLRTSQGWTAPGTAPVVTLQSPHPFEGVERDMDMLHIAAEWNEFGGVDVVFVARAPSGNYVEVLRLRAEDAPKATP